MAIYEVGATELRPIEGTSWGAVGLRERTDLQRLLRDQGQAESPDTLVIAEEFGEWTESCRRIDLLGIDKDANLVVIELQQTEDGGHMELQALRSAAMVSTLTSQRAIEIFGRHLEARGLGDDAEHRMLEFLEWDEFDEDKFAQDVPLVPVSGDESRRGKFAQDVPLVPVSGDESRELTTAVRWLNEKALDVRGVCIKPYTYAEQAGRVSQRSLHAEALGREEVMKYVPAIRKALTPRSSLILAVSVALLGGGLAARAYRRRRHCQVDERSA